ncbi:hypothetical protein SAMN02799622_04268 [Methylobacterium sp. UNC378MF]|uniref:hypothetical protein n=1 Tax=Methylobacterium sp. UNC378MF TaxID=1502748 RepID=UPI00088BF871|nr:hypothetical protein [Methylobacterium sp. UNC378MF]SDA28334.1 hypothetical protein SAMN02799622_04268 [Methylobacterium sp. UNC378MF]
MRSQVEQDDNRLFAAAEFRRRTNMGRTKEWELRRAGRLRAVMIGHRINYTMSELRRILAEGTEGVRHV